MIAFADETPTFKQSAGTSFYSSVASSKGWQICTSWWRIFRGPGLREDKVGPERGQNFQYLSEQISDYQSECNISWFPFLQT